MAGSAHFLFDGGLWGVRTGLYCGRNVSGAGAAIENPATQLDFLPASSDYGVVGRECTLVVAGLLPVHGRNRDGVFDRRPDQLGPSGMVYPCLGCLWRHHPRPDPPSHGGQVGRNPVDCRI